MIVIGKNGLTEYCLPSYKVLRVNYIQLFNITDFQKVKERKYCHGN
jgi:hypothetical protein